MGGKIALAQDVDGRLLEDQMPTYLTDFLDPVVNLVDYFDENLGVIP